MNVTWHAGRTALVTGAAGGLGREVVSRFLDRGAEVVAVDVSIDALDAAAEAWGAERVHLRACDLSDEAACRALTDEVLSSIGPIDVLANIAGILQRSGLVDTTAGDFRRILEINLVAPFELSQAFVPHMVKRGWGRVLNCTSIGGRSGYPFTAYSASKAALINLTKSLLHDTWGSGVTVNSVSPGAMVTPMLNHSARAQMTEKTPSGSIASAQDVAAAFDFLASPDAQGINGVDLVVDGGATAVFAY